MSAENFNFALKFPQNGGSLAQNFVFLDENFSEKKKIFRQIKIYGAGAGLLPLPRRHWTEHTLQHNLTKGCDAGGGNTERGEVQSLRRDRRMQDRDRLAWIHSM